MAAGLNRLGGKLSYMRAQQLFFLLQHDLIRLFNIYFYFCLFWLHAHHTIA